MFESNYIFRRFPAESYMKLKVATELSVCECNMDSSFLRTSGEPKSVKY
jgi:hypothetical protein